MPLIGHNHIKYPLLRPQRTSLGTIGTSEASPSSSLGTDFYLQAFLVKEKKNGKGEPSKRVIFQCVSCSFTVVKYLQTKGGVALLTVAVSSACCDGKDVAGHLKSLEEKTELQLCWLPPFPVSFSPGPSHQAWNCPHPGWLFHTLTAVLRSVCTPSPVS